MARRPRRTFDCPNCGAAVPVGAAACPECGSDEQTGWSDDTMYDGLDLPDPEDEGEPSRPRTRWYGSMLVAVIVLALALLFALIGWW